MSRKIIMLSINLMKNQIHISNSRKQIQLPTYILIFTFLKDEIICCLNLQIKINYKINLGNFIQLTVKTMELKSQDSIQVCIRIRPGQEEQSLVQFTQTQIHLDKNHFGFDKIFPPNASQQQIFQNVGTKLIAHTLDGYNGCIFVYGQTGSGKTYTMIGQGNGLMHRSFTRLFRQIEQLPKTECMIYCSYYEIYNEQIMDLLDTRKDKKLNIRQDLKKGVFVQNLVQETVYNEMKLLECLNTGMRNRHVGQTMMNRQSSRSHSIFTISFSIKTEVNGVQVLKTPKLHFVDLAGSQRQKMTAASGDRLKQAGNINKSLTTLGMVINALASQKTRTHIPYRDSKLTCLLRDSLGGNSKTFLIATISRNILCFQETLSTLNFANRAKMVKVKALVNQQSLSSNIQTYKQQIRKLKSEIARLKTEKRSPTPVQNQIKWLTKSNEENVNYDNQFKQINDKISVISEHLIKNPISPSLQSLLEQIKYLKPNMNQNASQMVDENQCQMQQHALSSKDSFVQQQKDEQDPLIQYLSCNNSLLEKIHTKIDEYLELKQQLRNLAYNNQLTIAKLKTPSKFQREQYETIIENRDNQINQLHSQLRQLRNLIGQQQIKIHQAINEAKNKSDMSEQNAEKFEKQRVQLQRQVNTLRNLMKQTNEEVELINKKYHQIQVQSRENKELYIYAEQNYETQKNLRDQIQNNLMQKIGELQEVKAAFTEKLQEQKDYFEEMQEGLRQQISVLAQTVEFNQNLVADYKLKLEKQKQRQIQFEHKIAQLEQQIKQNLIQKSELQNKLKSTQNILQEIKAQLISTKQHYDNEINQKKTALQNLNNQYQTLNAKNIEDHQRYQQILQQCSQQIQNLKKNLCSLQQKIIIAEQYYKKAITQMQSKYSEKIDNLNKAHNQQCQKYSTLLKNSQETSKQYEIKLNTSVKELQQKTSQTKHLQEQNTQIRIQCDNKIQQIYEQTKSKLEQTRILQIQNQQLKKQYKILQKQNYKIKAKYSQNNNKTQEQLALKVDYYEQKFKLMSIEYQKAMQVVKKLKQKQINQAQKIVGLEQAHKIMRMSLQNQENSSGGSSMIKLLSQENCHLKKQLQIMKTQSMKQQSAQSYMNKLSLQQQKSSLKQKEQYFKTKIQQSIKRWDPSKENICKTRSLEELIHSWEQLEAQSCKKFQAITKGIKKQQKIKTQNNLILKENIYLKQQINTLQKQMNEKVMGHPRKMVKLDMERIPQDSMQ